MKKKKTEECPLEYSDEETETILEEEGSLDGDEDEVARAAKENDR